MKKINSKEAIKIYNFAFSDREEMDENSYLSANRLGAISYKLRNLLTDKGIKLLSRYIERCCNVNLQKRYERELDLANESGITFRVLDEFILKARDVLREDGTLSLMVNYDEKELKNWQKELLRRLENPGEDFEEVKKSLDIIQRVPYLWTYKRYKHIPLRHIGAGLSQAARKVVSENGLVTVSDVVELGDDFWELSGITEDVGEELISKVNTQNPVYEFRPEKR